MKCKLERCNINYEQFGEGKPLILLHMWRTDHRYMIKCFEPIFEQRDGWKRIYPDMPGMGKSPSPNWMTTLDQMLDVLLEFIQNVVPDQRFCIGGISFGGYMAQGLIYRWPQMIDGVLLITPMIFDRENREVPAHVTLVENNKLLSEMDSEEADFFRGLAVVQNRELLESMRMELVPSIEIADHEFLDKLAKCYQFSFDIQTLPAPFEKPGLILLGRQDSAVGYRDAWNIIENYPRASFVVLDRSGHLLSVEQQGLFQLLTEEWLDRVEEYDSTVS